MSNYGLTTTGISNGHSDLFFGLIPGLKFNCDICNTLGEELLCLCNKCKKNLHPRCAGVETSTVYSSDGRKQVVLPPSDKLPKSCRECLTKQDGIMMISPSYLQQNISFGASSSNSITRFLESGMEPAHKLIEGNDCMTHVHKPGHHLQPRDNWTKYSCSGCKMEGFGLHYECKNSSCLFLLHEECVSPPKTTNPNLFPGLTFAFSCSHGTSSGRASRQAHICSACGLGVNGYFFHSLDGSITLHPCCITLPRETICSHTRAKLVLQKKTIYKCNYCDARRVKVGNELTNEVWSYVNENGDISWHISCLLKMLTELERDSVGRLISCNMSRRDGVGNMNLQLAIRDTTSKWKKKITSFIQYTKIALGAIIAGLLGDTTTLFVNSAQVLTYK